MCRHTCHRHAAQRGEQTKPHNNKNEKTEREDAMCVARCSVCTVLRFDQVDSQKKRQKGCCCSRLLVKIELSYLCAGFGVAPLWSARAGARHTGAAAPAYQASRLQYKTRQDKTRYKIQDTRYKIQDTRYKIQDKTRYDTTSTTFKPSSRLAIGLLRSLFCVVCPKHAPRTLGKR
jgi:hypothetical protein